MNATTMNALDAQPLPTLTSPASAPPAPPAPSAAPSTRRASVAIAAAPVLVLLAFTLVIAGVIEAAVGFAVFVVCTAWVVHELHRYQRQIDQGSDMPDASHSLQELR